MMPNLRKITQSSDFTALIDGHRKSRKATSESANAKSENCQKLALGPKVWDRIFSGSRIPDFLI